jgi:hypothetical protein
MRYISRDQLFSSLRQLAEFRDKTPRQGVKHLLAFLALRWRNVGPEAMTKFEERDDFAFFDAYMKVEDGSSLYFDPIALMRRAPGHPHSNVATARKGTFYRTWHAAVSDADADGVERWRLEPGYLQIIQRKALTKSGITTRAPAASLGAFLFRAHAFSDHATMQDVARELRTQFHLTAEEYDALFEDETTPGESFVREPLTLEEVRGVINDSGVVADIRESRADFQELVIAADDAILNRVRQLLHDDEYAGVVFVGPPGTSKSWYAVQVALALADGDPRRVRKIQFHPSFQYEQFVEGFVPNDDGTGFERRDRLMLEVIQRAEADREMTFVVLIDELSRSDPGRVFGELLTYMEPSRRDEKFLLASGTETAVPPNIVFIATMNSRDKSVVDIDDAFDRRVAKIEFSPDSDAVARFLAENGASEGLTRKVVAFFGWVQAKYPVGHTFFRRVRDEGSLKRLWETQLRFVFDKQFKYEPAVMAEIEAKFLEITGLSLT